MSKRALASIAATTAIAFFVAGCGDEAGSEDRGSNAGANSGSTSGSTSGTNGATNSQTTATNNATTLNNSSTAPNNAMPNNGGNQEPCDYEVVDGVLAIEAEDLPINEMWEVGTDFEGFDGEGYIVWSGPSHNNDPTNGVMSIAIRIPEAGRYQLDWRARIGMGTNTTEHNDAWVRFPDADDYYGLKGEEGAEIRRYHKPICEDADAMAAIEALPDVTTADCARGSTRDAWMKVYSSGASDWRWTARTSDSDASIVSAEFDAPGVYTLELAARADFFLIDRILLRLESVGDDDARARTPTACQ